MFLSPESRVVGRDRVAPAEAEGLRRDLDARRRLAAFVLAEIDPPDDVDDDRALEPERRDRIDVELASDVRIDDRVERLVRRQRVGVELIRPQLGRRRVGSPGTELEFAL